MSQTPNRAGRGDIVRVRSREEILATLDERGCVDGLPFMPEMLEHCGQVYRVEASAHKTCDTINKTGGRRMKDAVHLEELRCNGAAHGGCKAGCLFFFKNAWLERVPGNGADASAPNRPAVESNRNPSPSRCTEAALRAATRTQPAGAAPLAADVPYVCQTTELYRATTSLKFWNVTQYFQDVASGNVSLPDLLNRLFFRFTANAIQRFRGFRLWLGLYNGVQALLNNPPYPHIEGKLKRTPSTPLDLQPGDVVEVRSLEEILATLDVGSRNRGMAFDKEQTRFCGQRHVVQSRVDRIIDEATGKMVELPNACIILKGVACRAHYSAMRIACPRAIYSYWRECWLKRVGPEPS